ncbi:MAG: ribosome biogenesis GTPase Der [Myxococcota bacterium]
MPSETRDVESKATQWPQWALVGRVGVGKSTLFARLIGSGSVLGPVGPTRDWVEQEAAHAGGVIRLVDTAGYPDDEDPLRRAAWRQTQCVIRRADRLVLVTDARAGLLQGDEKLVHQLRRAGKSIVIAANKADSIALRHEAASVFSTLGVSVVPVSARQGDGIEQLFRVLAPGFGEKDFPVSRDANAGSSFASPRPPSDDGQKVTPSPKFVVLGKPNAGKSTFLNSLLGQERYVTSSVAGTTLDAVASMWRGKGQLYHLVDTPGLRRRSRVQQPLERAGGQAVATALRSSQVALLLIDSIQGVTQQDAKIASLVHRRRRGLVLVASKWDEARKQGISQAAFADALRRDLPFLSYAPLVFVSAWSRASVMRAVQAAQNVCSAYHERCATSAVNRCLHQAMQDHKPPRVRGRPLKMIFGWQDASAPPVFCLTCNRPAEVPDSYERYLIHRLRDAFGFVGVPITLVFRPKNP